MGDVYYVLAVVRGGAVALEQVGDGGAGGFDVLSFEEAVGVSVKSEVSIGMRWDEGWTGDGHRGWVKEGRPTPDALSQIVPCL